MPSSPRTPGHSRNSSAILSYSESPHARRQSRSSFTDSVTPFRNNLNPQDTLDLAELSGVGVDAGAGNGMGNLADELADAFSDSDDEEGGHDGDTTDIYDDGPRHQDSRVGNQEAQALNGQPGHGGSLNLPTIQSRGHRKGGEYDGSEYGSESDLESPGIPPSLVARIDAVESLARRGTENYGGPADGVFQRVTDSLRDLGSQSSVEASASR